MIEILYTLNIITFLILYAALPVYVSRYYKLGWLNPISVLAIVGLPISLVTTFSGPILLKNGWFNPYFQYALLVDNFHSLLGFLVSVLIIRHLHRNHPLFRRIERYALTRRAANPARMRAAALVFLGLSFACFLIVAQSSLGLLGWIANPRLGYTLKSGAGEWYAFSTTFLSVSVVLATVYARSDFKVLLLAPVYLFCAYMLGSKFFIISFCTYFVIILAIRRFRYFKLVAAILLGGGALLTASNFALSHRDVGFAEIAQYSDYYVNASMYYERYLNGQLPLYHGEIFLTNTWALIPRDLYPAKPRIYGIAIIQNVFYPGATDIGFAPAFATVPYFADFGWFGVIFYGIFNFYAILTVVLYAYVLPRLKELNLNNRIAHPRLLLYAMIYLFAPAFLTSFGFPLDFMLFAAIIGIIDVISRLRLVSGEIAPGRVVSTQA